MLSVDPEAAVTAFSAYSTAQKTPRRISRLLVATPTSYIGVQLLQRLGALGYPLRCLVPTHQPLEGGFPRQTEVVIGQALDAAPLTAALSNVDTAYYLFETMQDIATAALFARQASCAGVRRIIYLSRLGDDADDLPPSLRRSHEVGNILRREAKGVEVIEIRSAAVLGSRSTSFEIIRSISEYNPIITSVPWTRTPMQPIFIEDLLDYLVEAMRLFFPPNTIVEIGYQEKLRYIDLIKEYCKQRGLHRLIIRLPSLMPTTSQLCLQLTTPTPPTEAKTIIENSRTPAFVRDTSEAQRFSIQPISAKEAIAIILAQEESSFLSNAYIATGRKIKTPRGFVCDEREALVDIDAEKAFSSISEGKEIWHSFGLLWKVRCLIDRMLGGGARKQQTEESDELYVGKTLGSWRIEAFEEGQRLLLRSEMVLPGKAWLDISVEQCPNHSSKIRQRTIFAPKGLFGRFFWYLFQPIRTLFFKGLLCRLAERARGGEAFARLKRGQSLVIFRSWLPIQVSTLFRWHTTAQALERLTPPRLVLEKVVRSASIKAGGTVRLRFHLGLIPINWELKHSEWQQDVLFCDEQIKGPFHSWRHAHRFEGDPIEESSALTDEITYALPLGGLGRLLFKRALEKKLKNLFAFRHKITASDLALHNRYNSPIAGGKAMTVAITGAHGLVGQALTTFLQSGGYDVRQLVRFQASAEKHSGDISQTNSAVWLSPDGTIHSEAIANADVVIHLAGDNIASSRWRAKKCKSIHDSRVDTTKALCKALAAMDKPPKLLICASAIGFYGDCGAETVDESRSVGSGFLAEVCRDWEAATLAAQESGIRVVNLRLGMVLSPRGGALKQMITPFSMGLGGTIGSGKQCMSWIDIDDLLGIVLHAIATEELKGPVNAVSPYPVTNYTFTKVLGRHLHRPTIMHVPAFAARLAFGKMAKELLLASCRATPKRLLSTDYQFIYPTLDESLEHLLSGY